MEKIYKHLYQLELYKVFVKIFLDNQFYDIEE